MAEIHGKGAAIYLGAGGAAATLLGEQLSWSIDFDEQLVDVTPLLSVWKNFVKGLMGWTGTFGGNFDPGAKTLWTASLDTVVNNLYLYPQFVAAPTQYYYGTCWVQLGRIAEGSTTTKASNTFKVTGNGALGVNP